jgi:hypothetical protein
MPLPNASAHADELPWFGAGEGIGLVVGAWLCACLSAARVFIHAIAKLAASFTFLFGEVDGTYGCDAEPSPFGFCKVQPDGELVRGPAVGLGDHAGDEFFGLNWPHPRAT